MASEVTRKVLDGFGAAVTDLEAAIERRAPIDEIGRLDAEVAERMRDVLAHVDRLRSRRIA
jgi:hypothetical protein